MRVSLGNRHNYKCNKFKHAERTAMVGRGLPSPLFYFSSHRAFVAPNNNNPILKLCNNNTPSSSLLLFPSPPCFCVFILRRASISRL